MSKHGLPGRLHFLAAGVELEQAEMLRAILCDVDTIVRRLEVHLADLQGAGLKEVDHA